MKNKLLLSVRELMAERSMSLGQMNLLNISNAETVAAAFIKKAFFSKTKEETQKERIAAKQDFCRIVYKMAECPFQILTSYSWEDLLKMAWIQCDKQFGVPVRILTSWFHFILSSDQCTERNFQYGDNDQTALIIEFSYVYKESMRIREELYVHGEARVLTSPKQLYPKVINERLSHATFIVDGRLVAQLQAQKEYEEVIEILHVLHHLSTHDGMIHPVFLDFNNPIIDSIDITNPQILFSTKRYMGHDMYEWNFNRMMKQIFDIACRHTPHLYSDLCALISRVEVLTQSWDLVLQQYIRQTAWNRGNKLIDLGRHTRTIPQFTTFRTNNAHRTEIIKRNNNYARTIIHGFPGKEAIVHSLLTHRPQEIRYSDMFGFISDIYQKND